MEKAFYGAAVFFFSSLQPRNHFLSSFCGARDTYPFIPPLFFFFFSFNFFCLFLPPLLPSLSSSLRSRTVRTWMGRRKEETDMGFVSRGVYPRSPSQRAVGGPRGGVGTGREGWGRLHLVILTNSHRLFPYHCRGHQFGGIGKGAAVPKARQSVPRARGGGWCLQSFIFPSGAGGGKKRKGGQGI
ncbi:hypothetical protein LX36DRAFT_208961 [Colletotrichum falcatum]|nr:hypothetical protein LX36DRAFT_208961 [Colletotrichum falcatum]